MIIQKLNKQVVIVFVVVVIWLLFAHSFYQHLEKVDSTITNIQQWDARLISALFYQERVDSIKTSVDTVIIVCGIIIQLLMAVFLATVISRRYIRRLLEKRINQIEDNKNAFYKIFRPEESDEQWPIEDIKRLLGSKKLETLESEKIEDAPRLIDGLDTLIDEIKEKKSDIRWHDVSKLLYKVRRILCELNESGLADKVKKPYDAARRIIESDYFISYSRIMLWLLFFTIFFLSFNWLTAWLLGSNVVLEWTVSILFIVMGILIASIFYFWFQYYLRLFTEKTWTDLDDIIVGILCAPSSVIILGWATYSSFKSMPNYFKIDIESLWSHLTQDNVISVFVTIIVAWIVVFIFDRVIIYLLKRWAEKTEQKYDDMFVRILQVYGDFLIIAVAIAVILVKFQSDIKEATGVDNILLPYAILVSVFSAILGYASRESLENFFSGVLLQIDKPFVKGERLVLETGEICEVGDIGMRSTVLYNVLENTEISIPNSVMVSQKITNTSRPDWELRIPIKVEIPHDGYSLKHAEMILIDIAYLDGEIDQARITQKELTPELKEREREPIKEKLESLVKIYPHIKKTAISQIIGGIARRESIFAKDTEGGAKQFRQNGKSEPNLVIAKNLLPDFEEKEGDIFKSLDHITELRTTYAKQLDVTRKEISKLLDNKIDLDAGFTYTQLQRLIEEIVYRVKSHKKKSVQGFTTETLDYTMIEPSQRAIIFQEKNVENARERTTKNVEFIKQSLKDLASQIASQRQEKAPTDTLKVIELIAEHFEYKERMRLGLLATIQEELAWVADAIFTIGDTYRKDVRKEMDVLVSELGKEPTVHSKFVVTNDGCRYVDIDLNVYATHLERRFEVINKLNREIQRRFSLAEIEMYSLNTE